MGDAGGIAAPMREAVPWRGFLLDCLIAALLLVGLSVLLIVPIVLLHMAGPAAAGQPVGRVPQMREIMPAVTAAAITAMLLTALSVWWIRGRKMPGQVARMAAMPAYALALGAGIVIQLGAQSFAWLLARSGAGMEPSNAEPIAALLRAAPWLAWLLVVVVGPFAEELLMRHVLLRRFAVVARGGVGLVLTSVAFALLHEPAPSGSGIAVWLGGMAMYAGMGAFFGVVYLRTGRFRAAFLAHAACNATALVVAAYSAS